MDGPMETIDGVETGNTVAPNSPAAQEPDYANLLSVISDIRMKSGLGAKPMLSELADAIGEKIERLERENETYRTAFDGIEPAAPPEDKWAIDRSTDSPILTYEKCSVIQDEQAFYVLGLIRAAQEGREADRQAVERGEASQNEYRCLYPAPAQPAAQVVVKLLKDAERDFEQSSRLTSEAQLGTRIGNLERELDKMRAGLDLANDTIEMNRAAAEAEHDRLAAELERMRDASTLLLSEIDAPGDINAIVGASNPLRTALASLEDQA